MRTHLGIMALLLSVTSVPTSQAEDYVSKVKKAVEHITLNQPGTPPFHLRAELAPSFERDKGSARTGEVEIWWAAPDRWKREVRSPEFHQIDIMNGGHEWQKNDGDYFPEWLREMAVELVTPVPSLQEVLEQVKDADSRHMMRQLNISWVINTGTPEVHNIIRSGFAFSDDGQLLYGYGFGWGGDYKNYQKFHNRLVARKVSWLTPEVTATVNTLEDLGQVCDSLFKPDALAGETQLLSTVLLDEPSFRKNLLPTEPVAWPTVQDGPFQGNVTTIVVVDREGKVREIESVVSENSAMNDTGEKAVRNMRFKPFMVNGVPVQAVSQFTLPFKTGRPAGSENFSSAETYFERGRKVSFPAAARKSPYLLRAEFQFGGPGGSVQTGHYQDTWLDEDHWIRKAEAGDSSCTRSQDGDERYRDSPGQQAGILCLVLSVMEPIPAIDTFHESDWRVTRESLNGISTIRLLAGREGPDGKPDAQSRAYWFDDSGLLVQANIGGMETRRSDFQDFDGIRVAHRLEILKGGALAMKIHVTELTSVATASSEAFRLKGHEWKRAFTDEVR